jgi:hypothetical protein
MNCPWTPYQKAKFFDAFIFLSTVPNLKVSMDHREMMLSYKEYHTHISFIEDFNSVVNSLHFFLSDLHEYNKQNHQFYLHEEISSKEFHQKMIDSFGKKEVCQSASYVPKQVADQYNKTMNDIIAGTFFK